MQMRRYKTFSGEIDGLVQERRNSSALAMELHLSGTNLSLVRERCNSSALAMELLLALTHRNDSWGSSQNS